jgi:transposase
MPKSTGLALLPGEQPAMLAALRRARYGYVLALHMVLLWAAGRTPTDIAAVLFCARSSVYRTVRAYRQGSLGWELDERGRLMPPVRTTVMLPTLRRSLLALLKAPPRAYGWCRTRWSCATLALTLQRKRRIAISAETMRRWLHEIDWVWKRAKLVAKDDDPQRVHRLARIRWVFEQLKRGEARVFADELASHLLPKVGCAWMPQGTQLEVMTPGQNEQYSLAGALDLTTGTLLHCLGPRNTNALFRDLLGTLEASYPPDRCTRLYVVVDNDKIHQAKAVEQWLATHGSRYCACRPTVLARTPLSGPLATCMTAVPATIAATAYRTSWPMWKSICASMAPGSTRFQRSTMTPPSPRQLRKSPPPNTQRLRRECTNLLWTDLGSEIRRRLCKLSRLCLPLN